VSERGKIILGAILFGCGCGRWLANAIASSGCTTWRLTTGNGEGTLTAFDGGVAGDVVGHDLVDQGALLLRD
jgi:hypothetical protein